MNSIVMPCHDGVVGDAKPHGISAGVKRGPRWRANRGCVEAFEFEAFSGESV
jgi:hypothetical protein